MARISDLIEVFLKELLETSDDRTIEIQRNELAKYFECSPSQINYVLTTRFNIKQGYSIESQRGGGGYIKITQLLLNEEDWIRHIIIREIGDELSKTEAIRLIKGLLENKLITLREAKIIQAAIDDQSILSPINIKNRIRAQLFKNILITLLE